MSAQDYAEEEELRLALDVRRRLHDCKASDCQVYPDGTRRRNPHPGEENMAMDLPLLLKSEELAKDDQYRRPELSERVKQLLVKYRGVEAAAIE